MIFHLPAITREHPHFRNGRTHDEQQAIRLAIVAEGKDATRASVNRRLASTGIVATEGEFLRLFALYVPDLGVPNGVDDMGELPTSKTLMHRCTRCNSLKPQRLRRCLCRSCYRIEMGSA